MRFVKRTCQSDNNTVFVIGVSQFVSLNRHGGCIAVLEHSTMRYLFCNRCTMDVSLIMGVPGISLLYWVSHGYLSDDGCRMNLSLTGGPTMLFYNSVLWMSLL